jgi:hypothetical protein
MFLKKWAALLLGATVLAMGCASVAPPPSRGAPLGYSPRGTQVALVSPVQMAARAVASNTVQVDGFQELLLLAGLSPLDGLPSPGTPLSPREATRLLTVLLRTPVTLGAFPPRMAVSHLLREVLEGGEASREELLLRVERFQRVAVLRPDGYLAWTRNGRTQQRVGPVQWKDGAFRTGPFELGQFYVTDGWCFRQADANLRPLPQAPPLAEVYDDADSLNRTLEGAEEAFVELYEAMGQLLTRPLDSLVALQHLPAALATLIASAPEYRQRFQHLTRGEQMRELSKLATTLLVTWGTAAATTRGVVGPLAGAEATVPVLSLSAEGVLVMEPVVVPVGRAVTVLSHGPGAAIILHRTNASGQPPSPVPGPGQWGPAEESVTGRARTYQEQISGHSADEAYWVGGVGRKSGGVKFDGFQDGVLLEAKGPGYANKFLDNLDPKSWFESTGAKELVKQAQRQLRATKSMGLPIQWHVAEEKTAEAIRRLFKNERVVGIDVVYTPPL